MLYAEKVADSGVSQGPRRQLSFQTSGSQKWPKRRAGGASNEEEGSALWRTSRTPKDAFPHLTPKGDFACETPAQAWNQACNLLPFK